MLPVSSAEQHVYDLVKQGYTLNMARREVYKRRPPRWMPYFIPELFKSYLDQGYSRALATKKCGVQEGQMYYWAKTNPELADLMAKSRQNSHTSLMSEAAKRGSERR